MTISSFQCFMLAAVVFSSSIPYHFIHFSINAYCNHSLALKFSKLTYISHATKKKEQTLFSLYLQTLPTASSFLPIFLWFPLSSLLYKRTEPSHFSSSRKGGPRFFFSFFFFPSLLVLLTQIMKKKEKKNASSR